MVFTRFIVPDTPISVEDARIAIFNYVFSRRHNGRFILIRSKNDHITDLNIEKLKWLDIRWDDIIVRSQRMNLYEAQTENLLFSDCAYLELDNNRPSAIFDISYAGNMTTIDDHVLGRVRIDVSDFGDIELQHTSKEKPYEENLMRAVDDIDLHITHVIQSQKDITSAFIQNIFFRMLYTSSSYEDKQKRKVSPTFAHVPYICGYRSNKKMKDIPLSNLQNAGYWPETIYYYLSGLGWKDPKTRELKNIFAAQFDPHQLMWLQYQTTLIKNTDAKVELAKNWFENNKLNVYPTMEFVEAIVKLLGEDFVIGSDVEPYLSVVLDQRYCIPERAICQFLDLANVPKMLDEYVRSLERWDHGKGEFVYQIGSQDSDVRAKFLAEQASNTAKNHKQKPALLTNALKIIMSGRITGIDPYKLMTVTGKSKSIQRIQTVVELLRKEPEIDKEELKREELELLKARDDDFDMDFDPGIVSESVMFGELLGSASEELLKDIPTGGQKYADVGI